MFPDWLEPMAATLTQDRVSGAEWSFERKFDGIRLMAYKRGKRVELFSRNHLPQTMSEVAEAVGRLPVSDAILDGEVAWDGHSSYHVFDVLWLNGRSVTERPLEERRALLRELPFTAPMRRVRLLTGEHPWKRAEAEGWEGVIAKRRGSPYEHRRSRHWLKKIGISRRHVHYDVNCCPCSHRWCSVPCTLNLEKIFFKNGDNSTDAMAAICRVCDRPDLDCQYRTCFKNRFTRLDHSSSLTVLYFGFLFLL